MIKARLEAWRFDAQAWADALSECGLTQAELAQFLDVSKACIWHWQKQRMDSEFNFPSMHNFLKVANLLDLNVMDLFVLEQ